MAYDNEQMLAAPWKQEYGSRVFRNDAFLSYRRSNMVAVQRLANLMRDADATVWWDQHGEEDLRDRRLLEKIGHGVFHSRFIVVCISAANPVSEWMMAEFVKALPTVHTRDIKRVLVALLDEGTKIPEILKDCPFYEAWDNASALVEFVKSGNRLDFVPKEVQAAVSNEFFEGLTKREIGKGGTKHNVIQRILELPWKIDDPESDEFSYTLQSLRMWLGRLDQQDLDSVPGLGKMLLEACFRPALGKNTNDNRANAIGAMVRLAELGSKEAVSRLIYFLSSEQHAGVISVTLSWIGRNLKQLVGVDRNIALLAIIKAPNEAAAIFKDDFIRSLPEAVQCRLRTGRDLDPDALSRNERLAMAANRIDALLTESASSLNYSYFQSEFERMRDAALTFYEDVPQPKAASPELVLRAFDVLERLIRTSEERNGYPLNILEGAIDGLLTPLAMCYADKQHAGRARELFDGTCKVLLASRKISQNKIEACRSLFTSLDQGLTFNDAEAQFKEALHAAYLADEAI
jgi:TIR domain